MTYEHLGTSIDKSHGNDLGPVYLELTMNLEINSNRCEFCSFENWRLACFPFL